MLPLYVVVAGSYLDGDGRICLFERKSTRGCEALPRSRDQRVPPPAASAKTKRNATLERRIFETLSRSEAHVVDLGS